MTIISPCGKYRYLLTRQIPCELRWNNPCLFIMLNPSIADAEIDDPTIRRCIGFARSWMYSDLSVVNLFALRSTDPEALRMAQDPVGGENLGTVTRAIERHVHGVIIAAWGAHPMTRDPRTIPIRKLLLEVGVEAKCLGVTKDKSPRHPLYVKADQQPVLGWA